MKNRNRTISYIAGVVTVVASIIFVGTLVHALWYAPDGEVAAPGLAATAPARELPPEQMPARLQIPALDIDANVQYVGVKANGSMGTPNNFTDVAWYKYGTVPGQLGSAVIDGHVDNGLSLPGVFKHLSNIKIGDDVYVVTKEGTRLHFIVQNIAHYPYKSVPTDQIFNPKDNARLNLITCEGNWVGADKTYDERLVVYTVLAPNPTG